MASERRFSAVVVGGSVGGLAAAHELRRVGADVSVYERSGPQMQARGAGIVMQPEVEALLATMGIRASAVSVALTHRQMLHVDAAPRIYLAPQLMTAWDTLYATLRRPLADVCYRADSVLTAVSDSQATVSAQFDDGHVVDADLGVAADGVNSTARALLHTGGSAVYSGYVAWRGLQPEAELPIELVEFLAGKFSFFARPGMQMLCYLVPGEGGQNRGRPAGELGVVHQHESRGTARADDRPLRTDVLGVPATR